MSNFNNFLFIFVFVYSGFLKPIKRKISLCFTEMNVRHVWGWKVKCLKFKLSSEMILMSLKCPSLLRSSVSVWDSRRQQTLKLFD